MNIKNQLICISIIAVLSLCMFNNVAAAPVNKLTPDIHSNYAGDARGGGQQTYLVATFSRYTNIPMATTAVGQSVNLYGILTTDAPPTNFSLDLPDHSHGIPNAGVFVNSVNSDGLPMPVAFRVTSSQPDYKGMIMVKLTPEAAGVYNYQITYDGNDQYASAVSNVVSLTVTNMVIS